MNENYFIFLLFKERINLSLSLNVKIDDNIRQIKRKLILYENDLKQLKLDIPNTISDKRIRTELTVVSFVLFLCTQKVSTL